MGLRELENPEKLIAWLDKEDLLFRLSQKEAEIILGYLEGSGYSLETEDGILYQYDTVENIRTRTVIDEVVDLACEKNYELIEETVKKIANAGVEDDVREDEMYLTRLTRDEAVLDGVFKRTKYQKEMERIVQHMEKTGRPQTATARR